MHLGCEYAMARLGSLEPFLEPVDVRGHLVARLSADDEGQEQFADAVSLEVEREAKTSSCGRAMSTLTSISDIRSHSSGSCRGLSSGEQVGVPAQVERPAALGVDALADGLPTLEVAVEVAVLKHHARPLGCLGDEPNL